MENRNSQLEHGHPMDVRSVLHRQLSLAAVNQICVIHEAMNDCKKKKNLNIL